MAKRGVVGFTTTTKRGKFTNTDELQEYNVSDGEKPTVEKLLWDCREGRLEDIEKATATLEGPYTDRWGRSALHYASAGGHTEVVSHLRSVGRVDIDWKDERQQTALHVACQQGNLTMATYLLERCSAKVFTDKDGLTPLHSCVRNPQVVKYREMICLLLKYGVLINAQTKQGQTALHFACEGDLVEAVECLITQGASVSIQDKDELTPLLMAAIKGSADVIPLLVQSGADLNLKDATGRTPLHAACSEGHEKVVTTLIELGANQAALDKEGNIPLQKACHHGHLKIALTLINKGSDIHSIDKNGQASLHKACKGKDTQERRELITHLLSVGAKIDLQSKFARCALHCTCEDGNLGGATILLQNKAKPDLKDNDGCTPLHYAAHAGFSKYPVYNEIVTLLLKSGSKPNETNKMRMTAVHIAAKMGNPDIVRTLLEHNGDPQLLCQEEKTPLHYAVLGDPPRIESSLDVVECLVKHNVDINAKDKRGNTPLHYSSQLGNLNIVNLLVNKGASIIEMNHDGKSPEDYAAHVGVKNILLNAKQCSIYSKQSGTVPLPSVKLYLTGYKQVGKTTLRKHLGQSECSQTPSMCKRHSGSEDRTAGIEVEFIEHEAFGTLVVYDLAGHCEYSTSHSVVIDCANTSVFMVVFDITKERKASWKEVNHWSAFIKAGRYKGSRPKVMLVATHIDQVKTDPEIEYNVTFVQWKRSYSKFFHIIDEPFMINALLKDTPEISKVRSAIGVCCSEIKATVKVPTICFSLMKSLRTIFDGTLAMKVEDVIKKIQLHNTFLAMRSEELHELLQYLSIMGMILLLNCGWVIFMKEDLLEHIFSIIFAPEHFYLKDLSKFRHGKIPIDMIEGLFLHKKYDKQLVLDILCELMLGKVDSEGKYIHIPALLKEGRKNDYWKRDDRYHVFGGLRAKCSDATDIFSPCSFSKLQVIFLNRKGHLGLTLFLSGILLMQNRVQILMSMQTNRRSIDVYVRGEKGTETQCYRLRQEMWDVLSCELQNSSSGTNYYRQIIRPQDVKEGKDEPVAYNFNDVLECEKNGNIYISAGGETESRDSIKELLYCNSNETILVTDQHFSQDPPSDAQLWSIARDISDCWFQIGAQIGLPKHELDRIKVDYTDVSLDQQSFQMLYMAGQKPCFTSCADLAKLLYKTDKFDVIDHLKY